jgi:hypothetical protein
MILCVEHKEHLEDELVRLGLGEYIERDPFKLLDKQGKLLDEGLSIDTFDAVVGAYYEILSNWQEIVGDKKVIPTCIACLIESVCNCEEKDCGNRLVELVASNQLLMFQELTM